MISSQYNSIFYRIKHSNSCSCRFDYRGYSYMMCRRNKCLRHFREYTATTKHYGITFGTDDLLLSSAHYQRQSSQFLTANVHLNYSRRRTTDKLHTHTHTHTEME
jgi:hypothetical protein